MPFGDRLRGLAVFGRPLWNSTRDLLPIIVVIGLFQALVFRQPLPDAGSILLGVVLVIVGLALFVIGLERGLFPVGERMAQDFAHRGSLPWLLLFAFALGFGTTFAEPTLIAVADKAAELTVVDAAEDERESLRRSHSLTLRATVAVSIGCALALGVLRIIFDWPVPYLILPGFALLTILAPCAPPAVVGVAYDVGCVTMSTVTVPLTAALGVGLVSSLKGRNPLEDGFGMIALSALTASLFVMLLGVIWQ